MLASLHGISVCLVSELTSACLRHSYNGLRGIAGRFDRIGITLEASVLVRSASLYNAASCVQPAEIIAHYPKQCINISLLFGELCPCRSQRGQLGSAHHSYKRRFIVSMEAERRGKIHHGTLFLDLSSSCAPSA